MSGFPADFRVPSRGPFRLRTGAGSFASGGSCLSGAAISNGEVFWGSGYSSFGFGTFNNKLYAFELP